MLPSFSPDQGIFLIFLLSTLIHYTEEEGSHFGLLYLLAGLAMADLGLALVAVIWVGVVVLFPRLADRFS
jgi:hypothetical protein